ncbi:uncharacterized protein LTR77_002542 [Saxophila tyrrhenica]|uniref:Paraoxonase n=1 Tax=Saxophila tyrrhenica TaxID=1690608 RepID=A0AAV9PNL5_9PEZI|nr:hypothetical protein LTR77_002542 [Saxophila tyrrhenica]
MPSFRPRPYTTAFVVLVSLFLYNRGGPLSRLYLNAPSRLEHVNNLNQPSVQFADTVRNCEDVILVPEESIVLLSCDPSRDTWNTVMGTFVDPASSPDTGIYMWNYKDSNAQPEKIQLLDFNLRINEFHPLGIEYHAPSNTLFVVNHAPSGSAIEFFKFLPSEAAATHITTLEEPKNLATPNSIAVLSETEFLVTNDHWFRRRFRPVLALLETYMAFRGGSVTHVKFHSKLADGFGETTVLTQIPFANGITQLNDSVIAVASSSMNTVYLYSMNRTDGSAPKLKQIRTISVPFHPDNLSVDGNGKLLIAGHPHAPTTEKVSKGNRFCQSNDPAEREKCLSKGLSWVAEWSEAERLKTLYAGDEFGTSTTAVRDVKSGMGIITGLYAKGLYVWRD